MLNAKRRWILLRFFFLKGLLFLLSGCGGQTTRAIFIKHPVNQTYKIRGIYYTPQQHYEYCEEGIASHYGGSDGHHGELTSLGGRFNMFAATAAHKTLPLPCMVRVENLENGKNIELLVNDRGPFIPGRILDVSCQAAKDLGFYEKGIAKVRLTTLVDESVKLAQCPPPHIKPPRKKRTDAKAQRIFHVGQFCEIPHIEPFKKKMKEFGRVNVQKIQGKSFVHLGPFHTIECAQELKKNIPNVRILACLPARSL